MKRIVLVVEGETEQEFVESVLTPHFAHFDVHASATLVGARDKKGRRKGKGGGGPFKTWITELRRVLRTSDRDLVVSSLFDLYGLPTDFPRRDELWKLRDTVERCAQIEREVAALVNDRRFVSYVQRHEFEALVLAALPGLRSSLDSSDFGAFEQLEAEVAGCPPEDVNDGRETAPSKRIRAHLQTYQKWTQGPQAIRACGLEVVRRVCPRFDTWLASLETRVSS